MHTGLRKISTLGLFHTTHLKAPALVCTSGVDRSLAYILWTSRFRAWTIFQTWFVNRFATEKKQNSLMACRRCLQCSNKMVQPLHVSIATAQFPHSEITPPTAQHTSATTQMLFLVRAWSICCKTKRKAGEFTLDWTLVLTGHHLYQHAHTRNN